MVLVSFHPQISHQTHDLYQHPPASASWKLDFTYKETTRNHRSLGASYPATSQPKGSPLSQVRPALSRSAQLQLHSKSSTLFGRELLAQLKPPAAGRPQRPQRSSLPAVPVLVCYNGTDSQKEGLPRRSAQISQALPVSDDWQNASSWSLSSAGRPVQLLVLLVPGFSVFKGTIMFKSF